MLNDRQLVQFRTPTVGARVLANNLPSGKTMWLDVAAGTVQVVKASASQRPARLLSLALPDGQLQVVDLVAGEDVRAVHRYGEVILLIRNSDVRAHSLNDGRLLGRILNPHRWMNGRYFLGQNNFYFAVWDGTNVAFEPVTLPNNFTPSVISHIFDRTGLAGPWLVHKSGAIIPTAGGEELKLPMPPAGTFGLDQVRISRDGHRLYVAIPSLDWGRQLDLESGWVLNILPTRSRNLCLDVPPALPTRNLFSSIESIARLRDGLAICGRKKRWRKLTLNGQGKIQLSDTTESDRRELVSKQSFSTTLKQTSPGCSLQLAEWPSGSKAFLDSRGLLHLKSHVASVPEISFVLSSGEIAGWASEGHVCGPQFFFEGTHHSDPARIFANVLQFLNYL